MIIETIVDLCDVVSGLANDRDALQRKVDALTSQLPDQEPAASTEFADLRAKLALQQQIATGAATQRDEQTARLTEAQAEIARLKAGNVPVDRTELGREIYQALTGNGIKGWMLLDESQEDYYRAADVAIARLTTPQTGEVGT